MFRKEYLYFLPRDEPFVYAAHSLAEVAREMGDPYEAAAVFALAAAMMPAVFGKEADDPSWAISEPDDAYQAVLERVVAYTTAFRRTFEKGNTCPLECLCAASKTARLSSRAAWLADLVDEVRVAIEKQWEYEHPPEDLPPPELVTEEPESDLESKYNAPKL
jgi:hypothetical protein